MLSFKEVDMNSDEFSLSSGVESILQDQEPCDLVLPLRIGNHIGIFPSAPLATQPTFMSNLQEAGHGVVTLLGARSIVPNDSYDYLQVNDFSHIFYKPCMIISSSYDCKHALWAKDRKFKTQSSDCAF